jgi:5-methylcytosine-specific restriction endonuclease McrA
MSERVLVETVDGQVVRIFRNNREAVLSQAWEEHRVKVYKRRFAVGEIRSKVFSLSEGLCHYCGKYVPHRAGHMHEQIHRGEGGEISTNNSVWACYKCHMKQHPEKQTRFGEHDV